MSIVERAPRPERRRLMAMARKSHDPDEVRRALAVLQLMDGGSVSRVGGTLAAARSTVYRWARWYVALGLEGLRSQRRGPRNSTVTPALVRALVSLMNETPRAMGYLRSTWSSELLAHVLWERFGLEVHPSTLRRVLPRLGYRWRRARPTLCIRDPDKAQKLAAIQQAIKSQDPHTEVLFLDEADIDFNPRIGYAWRERGRQEAIPTPGQNQKHYVAGALHARTGRLTWVEHRKKNSVLFLKLLIELRRRYRRARRIVLILDNYRIHKSLAVRRWLSENPKFELLFQPVYHPWVNDIERLWKAMHDTVTRNHRCRSMTELCQHIMRFFEVVQPFPGNAHGVAQLGSAI